MAIFLDSTSRVIVQGMTGAEGIKHTRLMLSAGTRIVGGVNPRKAGQTVDVDVVRPDGSPGATRSLPVFGTVAGAMADTGANVSVVFVPPAYARGAVIEAIDAAMPLVVVITEGIPVADAVDMVAYAKARRTRIIGPNCPGIITPGQSGAGITPANITGPGPLGLVSKSGTLTYQLMHELRDVGFSTCIGIGGDPVVGTTHIDALAAFEADPETRAIIMIGEIGGDAEERAAEFIRDHVTTPVIAYIAGFTAPEGKTMGHAGAIVSGSAGTAQAKAAALGAVGVPVATTPRHAAAVVREVIGARAKG
ncbi:MAG: succinate--CoA ligase subunit alpha [Bifidobacteriaceae bacterium]|jgi:succinyl-CoA synthetase alpha subunit|nr:succinate--CoA ligase subunit alpha [Bifidobacteriaceae bacterium]